MAKNEEKVMEFVSKELDKNPGIATSELFEKAKKVDTGVGKLSLRQFNARFPLQIKRRKSLARPSRRRRTGGGRKKSRAVVGNREAVREVFVRFASDLTAADEKRELVKVLAGLDRYVDDAIKAAGKK